MGSRACPQQVVDETCKRTETVLLVGEDHVCTPFWNHPRVGQTLGPEGSRHIAQLFLHHVKQAAAALIH